MDSTSCQTSEGKDELKADRLEQLPKILSSAETLMRRHDAGAMLITHPDDVLYWSGAYLATQRTIRERIAAVVIVPKNSPILLVCDVEEKRAQRDSWLEDIRTYVEFRDDPIDATCNILRRSKFSGKRLLVDMGHLVARESERLAIALPGAELIDCREFLENLRSRKSRAEVALLEQAAHRTAVSMQKTFAEARVGEPVKGVLDSFAVELLSAGADSLPFLSVGYDHPADGFISLYANPGEVKLEPGMLVRLDCSGLFNGYHSDLARMAVVGAPSDQQRSYYSRLVEIHEGLLYRARPGFPIRELYLWCRTQFQHYGMTFDMPHIGHSLGLGYHEKPVITPYEYRELEPGMVMALEPITYERSVGGFHIEDVVLITEQGSRLISGPIVEELPVIGESLDENEINGR